MRSKLFGGTFVALLVFVMLVATPVKTAAADCMDLLQTLSDDENELANWGNLASDAQNLLFYDMEHHPEWVEADAANVDFYLHEVNHWNGIVHQDLAVLKQANCM